MLLHPRVLLADEPTSALDVSVQKQVVEQFLMIREKFGTSILLVSHNIGVIRAMADEILVLHQERQWIMVRKTIFWHSRHRNILKNYWRQCRGLGDSICGHCCG